MKNKLLLTTALTTSLLGYYRRAYSACTGSSGTYTCSGTTTTNQSISANNAQVSTEAGFGIETSNDNATISITGAGAINFTDENSSTIVGGSGNSLRLNATGDINGGNVASITVDVNSDITSDYNTIYTTNNGSGATNINIAGELISGEEAAKIINESNTSNISITTTSTSSIKTTKYYSAIYAYNKGNGATTINVAGYVYGNKDGIQVVNDNSATNISITTSNTSEIKASSYHGILATNAGSGSTTLSLSGDITVLTGYAVYINNSANSAANITIQDGATISGNKAISSNAANDVAFDVTLNGSSNAVSLTGTGGTAIEFDANATNDDKLTISGAVSINGDVAFGAGTDTLNLNDASLTLATGTDFTGLENFNISGSNTVNGNLNLGGLAVNAVNGADLKVNNGTLTASVNLGNGSILSGTSTIAGSVVAASGASIAPGNSVGTITVNGDVTFNTGSSFDVEVDGNSADKLIADNITIQDGVTLNITPINNSTSGSATILEANDSLTGTFSNVVANNGANVTLTYAADNLSLSFVTLNTNNFNSQVQTSVDSSILFNDNLTNQLALNAFDKGNHFWVRGIYRNQDISAKSSGTYGYDNNSYGVAFGAEKELTNLGFDSAGSYKLGFALSQVTDSLSIQSAQGSRKSQSTFATIYGNYSRNLESISSQFFTSLSLGLGYHVGDNKRLVTNSGVASYATSSSKDTDINATLQTGLKLNLAKSFYVMPYLSASYIQTFAGGFSERSGGNSAVSINDYSFATAKYRESIRFGANLPQRIKNISFSPYLDLGLSQERAIGQRSLSGKFNVTQSNFNANLANNNRNFIITTVGMKANLTKDISSFLSFERSSSSQEVRHEAKLGVGVKF